jgi:hypothetical protein
MDDTPRRVSGADDDAEDVDARTREIRSEIEDTRAELSETIDAIQDKLKPRNVVASATDRVKHAASERVREMAETAGETAQQAMNYTRDTASGMTERARQNPIPLALIGIGAAWLLSNRSRRDTYGRGRYGTRERREYEGGQGYGSWTRDDAIYGDRDENGVMARIRNNPIPAAMAGVGLGWLAFSSGEGEGRDSDRWSGGFRNREWGDEYGEGAGGGGMTGNLAESARDMTARTREYASDTTDSMRRMARQRQNQLQRMVQENPLLVGAGALMLGAAFGMAVPETETENEWMGEARDNVVGRARKLAEDAAGQVQDAAGSVADAAAKITGKSQSQ